MELDACKLDFENLQNYAEKAVQLCTKSANYAEKKWLCSASHGKGSTSRVLGIL